MQGGGRAGGAVSPSAPAFFRLRHRKPSGAAAGEGREEREGGKGGKGGREPSGAAHGGSVGPTRPPSPMAYPANLRTSTKILDFRGFDSSRILNLWAGILMYIGIGDFPDMLSQQILVGIIFIGRFGRIQRCANDNNDVLEPIHEVGTCEQSPDHPDP